MAGLSSAGAAAGTAIMPGVGTAVGGVLGALADSFMGGGGSASAAPQNAQSAIYGDLGQDSSGWNVNFSGVQSNGSNKAGTPSITDTVGTSSINPLYIVVGGIVFVAIVWLKTSKSSK